MIICNCDPVENGPKRSCSPGKIPLGGPAVYVKGCILGVGGELNRRSSDVGKAPFGIHLPPPDLMWVANMLPSGNVLRVYQ